MIFMGIDIGYDRCGVSIIKHSFELNKSDILFAGSIITDRTQSFSSRLHILHEDLMFLKNKYAPEYISIEKLFFNRKNPTFEKICMSKGIAMLIFNDSMMQEIEPKKMKLWISGYGNATKKDIKISLERYMNMNLSNVLDDTVDAVCLAMYHIDQVKIDMMVNRSQLQSIKQS